MPVHHRAAPAVLALTLTACAAGAATAPDTSEPPVDPPGGLLDDWTAGGDGPGDADRDVVSEDAPYEIVVTAHLRSVLPEVEEPTVEMRQVVAGDRLQLTTTGPFGRVLDDHVAAPDEHWVWILPDARAVVDAEWVRVDVAALDDPAALPEAILRSRLLVPEPGSIVVGDRFLGWEVLAVEELDGDAVRLAVAELPDPVEVRRRPLPAGTTIEAPVGAVDAADLPAQLDLAPAG